MSANLIVVKPSFSSVTSGLIKLDDAMLEVDVDKAVDGRVWGPFDESWFGAVHLYME